MITEKLQLTCGRPLSQQLLASCPLYSSIPLHGKELMIYSNLDVQQTMLLSGHHGDVTAMTFGKGRTPVLLCSASADYIIVWDIDLCLRRTREGNVAHGLVIGTSLGEIVHLSFCFSDERVVACSGTSAYILTLKKEQVIITLSGHLGPLTSAEFCPWNKDILVTTSEDRTFKVWDLKTASVFYNSFVLSATPLISVLFLDGNRHIITGSADGQVWCFTLSDDFTCQLVTKMDLQTMEKRHQAGVADQSSVYVETSKPALKIFLCCAFKDTTKEEKQENSWICIGSIDGLYVVDLASSELLVVLYFKDFSNLSITMARSWSASDKWDSCCGPVGVQPVLSEENPTYRGKILCVPKLQSPLNSKLKKKELNQTKKKGGIRDQPLVFHSDVKSSGYTSSPRRTIFSPKTNVQKMRNLTKDNRIDGVVLKDYPKDSAAPVVPHTHLSISNKPVCCLQYSGDGKHILSGLGDNSVLLLKSTLTGNSAVYTGHDKPVSKVSWSLDRQSWLSASEDRTVRIWANGNKVPAVIMGDKHFSKPIRGVQFYYLDKFLLLASGDSLCLYLHHVDTSHDDIKRYHHRSTIKLAEGFTTTSGTDISDMSAINDFLSYIVLVCGVDRSIQVFDMNKGKVAAELPDAHSRSIHCIVQNKGSMFSTQAADSYNLFLTSAVTDGVKLWDLRTLRCVRRYENHLNRCHPCASAISPCGRFIGCGSEDNCAYVYDVRSSHYLHKLQKHSETVLSVAFNPARPELLTGTLDGKLGLFQPSTGTCLSHDTGVPMTSVLNMTP